MLKANMVLSMSTSALMLAQIATWSAAKAASLRDFYKGKNVSMVIGYSAGGGYDLYARLLAGRLGDHLPGKPKIVPQNMPGAGSLNAVKFLIDVAPRDGAVLGTFARGMPIYPLLFTANFDGSKLEYVGSVTTDTSLCITWHTSRIKNWQDLMTIPSVFGGEGKGSDPDLFANLLKNEFGAKDKLVTGYPGTADISLAMERGEIDGLCGISYSTLTSRHGDWLRKNEINIIVQAAVKKNPNLKNVPSLLDLATTPKQKQIIKLAVAPEAMARPFAMPPGVPADRLQAMRAAFDATMKDPAFLGVAAKSKIDVNPLPGPQIQSLVKELYATPKAVVREASKAMGG